MRQHLGEQLEEIARFCRLQGKEAGYRLIIEVLTTAVRPRNTPCVLHKIPYNTPWTEFKVSVTRDDNVSKTERHVFGQLSTYLISDAALLGTGTWSRVGL